MPRRFPPPPDSESGAILVHVAIGILALISFSAFTVDNGVLLLSRRQAQNSADAGALAGATSLAFESPNDLTDGGLPKQNAYALTQANLVYGVPPDVVVSTDITFPTCPASVGGGTCIRVDVYRMPDRNNPLPAFFGLLWGRLNQGIRATAMAHVGGANSARCMLPWILADRWADDFDDNVATYPNDGLEGTDGWSMNDHYQEEEGDWYLAPYEDGHTGWTVDDDHGRQLILHNPVNQFSPGSAGIVNLPGSNGADDYRFDIWNCNQNYVAIAEPGETCEGYNPASTTPEQALEGCLGVQTGWIQGPTEQAVTGPGGGPDIVPLIEQDEDAIWSWEANGGEGAVVKDGELNMSSPRIRPIAVFDITHYMASNCQGTPCVAKVVNIIGFFVEGLCADLEAAGGLEPYMSCDPDSNPNAQVVGRIVPLEGDVYGPGGSPVDESSFLKVIRLIR